MCGMAFSIIIIVSLYSTVIYNMVLYMYMYAIAKVGYKYYVQLSC